jgi:hypothetical protein
MRHKQLLLVAVLAVGCTDRTSVSAGDASPPAPLKFPADSSSGNRDASSRADASSRDATASDAPPAALTIAVAPNLMTPAFSPAIHDYYVRCGTGMNALTVSMSAPRGGTVALLQPTTTPAVASRTMTVKVPEDGAIVVNAALGFGAEQFWIRCIPHDFPWLSMSLHPNAGTPTPGYYLVGNTFLAPHESGYAMVLDGNGTPVWYGATSTGGGPKAVDVLDSNTISFSPLSGYTFGNSEGSFEIHSLDPVNVHDVAPAGLPLDTHELRRLPNGDYLMFAAPVVTGLNLTGLTMYSGRDEAILDCVIQEVESDGSLVWQWDALDHFDPVQDCTWPQLGAATNTAGKTVSVVDPFHCNSIDVDPSGNLLVSARHMDTLFLVSKATGQVLWKMGGSTYNKDGAPYIHVVDDPLNGFYRQHDARFQPDGTITVFDDETARRGPARGLRLSYDVDAGTAEIVWQYSGVSTSAAMGSVTILPDGSHVIGWGIPAGGSPAFTELDTARNDLLDFYFTDGDTSYRALKVPLSALSIDTLRAAVGPWSSVVAPSDAGVVAVTDAGLDANDADAAMDAGVADATADGY